MMKNAYKSGNIDLIKYLLTIEEVDIKSHFINILNTIFLNGENILQRACKSGNIYLVKYLIPLKIFRIIPKDKSRHKNILFYACRSGNLKLVDYLISLNQIDLVDENVLFIFNFLNNIP